MNSYKARSIEKERYNIYEVQPCGCKWSPGHGWQPCAACAAEYALWSNSVSAVTLEITQLEVAQMEERQNAA